MVEYGRIDENGIMTSKMLEPYNESFRDDYGELKERVVSVEKQADILKASGWKPVDLIDESKMIAEEGYTIEIIPYDAGEKISYQYVKTFDKKEVENKIRELKKQLSVGDYKIIKCYEASLLKEVLPYDVENLHKTRNELRKSINELEKLLEDNL
ncbi:hypothetical protein [Parabacteroides johnsonii]|uniref:hypothetical protein n=1 Tax=Parabacteroides johnsonii TaxID=387661 RepID=UPI002432E45C|nr:hypothetical protein [Parabacteroides johnsonii]